jgi:hypothetical protein
MAGNIGETGAGSSTGSRSGAHVQALTSVIKMIATTISHALLRIELLLFLFLFYGLHGMVYAHVRAGFRLRSIRARRLLLRFSLVLDRLAAEKKRGKAGEHSNG